MMNFFYPVKTGTENNKELRYSIRSVYAQNPNAVIWVVSGNRPKWANSKLRFICQPDNNPLAGVNVWKKIQLFCQQVKQPFINMNDDIFLVNAFDWQSCNLHDETLEKRRDSISKSNRYWHRVNNTDTFLKGLGMPTLNYDIHQPMYMDWHGVVWMDQHLNFQRMNYLYKSIYGNICGMPAKQGKHCKLTNPADFDPAMIYFSINDEFVQRGGYELLDRLYPKKSIVEI